MLRATKEERRKSYDVCFEEDHAGRADHQRKVRKRFFTLKPNKDRLTDQIHGSRPYLLVSGDTLSVISRRKLPHLLTDALSRLGEKQRRIVLSNPDLFGDKASLFLHIVTSICRLMLLQVMANEQVRRLGNCLGVDLCGKGNMAHVASFGYIDFDRLLPSCSPNVKSVLSKRGLLALPAEG